MSALVGAEAPVGGGDGWLDASPAADPATDGGGFGGLAAAARLAGAAVTASSSAAKDCESDAWLLGAACWRVATAGDSAALTSVDRRGVLSTGNPWHDVAQPQACNPRATAPQVDKRREFMTLGRRRATRLGGRLRRRGKFCRARPLVPRFRSSHQSMPLDPANFGIGTLTRFSRPAMAERRPAAYSIS